MVCYNIYAYNRAGTCVFYHEWYRPKSVKQGAGTLIDDQKQMFGLFWTLNNFCATIDPKDASKPQLGTPRKIGQGCTMHSFTANNYKMNYFESPSGIKIILNTSREVGDLAEVLQYVYEELFIEHVIKHPLYQPGQTFQDDAFTAELSNYLRQRGLMAQQPGVTAAPAFGR